MPHRDEIKPFEGEILPEDDVVAVFDDDGEVAVYAEDEYTEDQAQPRYDDGFNANLALDMQPSDRATLCAEIKELIDNDDQSREDWKRRMVDGLTVIGVNDVPEDNLPFPRASRVTHPCLVEIMTQFQARAVEELFPPGGPVKGIVLGDADEELEAQSERVEKYMNYHLTDQDEGYFADTDQMLYYLPYSGSVFRKVQYDWLEGFPTGRYVTAEDFIVPYSARSLREAPRYSQRMWWAINDIKRLQSDEVFVDYDIEEEATPQGTEGGSTEMRDESDKREETSSSIQADTLQLFESHIDLHPEDVGDTLPGTELGFKLPYIVILDPENQEVLSIRRNWKEIDQNFRKRIWFAHYKYLPGLGFYGWGIMHVAGGLGVAASGVVRALLDFGLRANASGGFVSKDFRARGDYEMEPGVWKEVDGTAEEIAKGFFPFPTASGQGTPALFSLLEALVNSAKSFGSITEALVGEASNTGPVGTTIALIEQSMKVMSGIHKRMHAALRQELRMMSELIHESMPDEYPYRVEGGAQSLLRSDFDERIDISPVSDPNIFSSTQRIAIAQALYQLVNEDQRGVFDDESVHEVYRRLLTALRVPEIERILPDKEQKRRDPVSENQNLMVGKPMRAFIDQNHVAHIIVHQGFLQEMALGNPEKANEIAPVLLAHIAQHEAYAYRITMQQAVFEATGEMMPPYDMLERQEEEMDPETEAQIAEVAAMIVQMKAQELAQQQQAQQQAQMEAEAAPEIAAEQRKQAAFEGDQQRKDQGFQLDQQRKQQDAESRRQLQATDKISSMLDKLGYNQPKGAKPDGK